MQAGSGHDPQLLAGSLTSLHFQRPLSALPKPLREPLLLLLTQLRGCMRLAPGNGLPGSIHFPAVLLFELGFPAEVISGLSGIYLKKVWSLTRPVNIC